MAPYYCKFADICYFWCIIWLLVICKKMFTRRMDNIPTFPYRGWLITYKLCLLMHLIHTSQAPSYLTDIVTQTASVTSRTRLQSGSSLRYEQPRTRLKFGQRAFSYTAPAVWNSLPPSLQELSDTASFKRNFKTLLFQRAFYLWVVFTFCTLSFYPRGIYHEVSKQTGLHLSFFMYIAYWNTLSNLFFTVALFSDSDLFLQTCIDWWQFAI